MPFKAVFGFVLLPAMGFKLDQDEAFSAFNETVELPMDMVNVIGAYYSDLQTSLSDLQEFQQPVPFSKFTPTYDFIFQYKPQTPQYYFKPKSSVMLHPVGRKTRAFEFTMKQMRDGDCSGLAISQTRDGVVTSAHNSYYISIRQTDQSFRIQVRDVVMYSSYSFSLVVPDTCLLYLTQLTRILPGDRSLEDLMRFGAPKPALLGFYSTEILHLNRNLNYISTFHDFPTMELNDYIAYLLIHALQMTIFPHETIVWRFIDL